MANAYTIKATPESTDSITISDVTGQIFRATLGSLPGSSSAVGGYVEPPVYSDSAGIKGQYSFDASYVYICIADNSWDRFPVTWDAWGTSAPENPVILSATIDVSGEILTLVFDRNVFQGSAYLDSDFNLDASIGGEDIGITYQSGDGTMAHIYSISTVIREGETVDIDYSGRANGLEDEGGNDLQSISSMAVTNLSEDLYSDIVFWDGFDGTITDTTYEATNYDYPPFHSGVIGSSTVTVTPSYRVVGDKCLYFNSSSVNTYLGFGPMPTVRGRAGLWWRPVTLLTGRPIVTLTGDVTSYHWSLGIQVGDTADVVTIKGRCNGSEWLTVGYSITLPYELVLLTAYFVELSWDYETGVFNIFIDGELVGTITKVSTLVGTFTHVFPGRSFLIPTAPNMAVDNLIISTDPNRDLYALALLEAYPG